MKFVEKSRQTLIKEEKRGKRYNSHWGRRTFKKELRETEGQG